MKLLMKNIFAISCCLISFCGMSASEKNRPEKHVDVKCYVELVGGGETISFWNIKATQREKLANKIVGKNVTTPFSRQPQQIYKVHECALLKDDFISAAAKRVDKITAR